MTDQMVELQRKKQGLPPLNSINYNSSSATTIAVRTHNHNHNHNHGTNMNSIATTNTTMASPQQLMATTVGPTGTTPAAPAASFNHSNNNINVSGPNAYDAMGDPIISPNQAANISTNTNTNTNAIISPTHQRVYPATSTSSTNVPVRNGKKLNLPNATDTDSTTPTTPMATPLQPPSLPKAADSSTLMLNEDERMRHFLTLLSARKPKFHYRQQQQQQQQQQHQQHNQQHNQQQQTMSTTSTDTNTTGSTESDTGPTVPLSLSRRILNRQGVNYMDESVSALMSAAADRFLATVLHQSKICHNRRLQGEEAAKEERRSLNRMKKRRREEKKLRQQKRLAIEKELVVALNTPATGPNGTSDSTKTKKSSTRKVMTNSVTSKMITDVEKALKDDKGNDSMDEEMEYYDNYLQGNRDKNDGGRSNNRGDGSGKDKNNDNEGNQSNDDDSDEDDDNDDDDDDDSKLTLQLRDVVRPLEAWGVSLTGKVGLSTPAKHVEITKMQHETDADDDNSNPDVDGDSDIDVEEEDDKSVSGASTSAASKQKSTDKVRKRVSSPKGSNLKSPATKTKQRKASPILQTGLTSTASKSGRSTTPSASAKAP